MVHWLAFVIELINSRIPKKKIYKEEVINYYVLITQWGFLLSYAFKKILTYLFSSTLIHSLRPIHFLN